VGNTLSLGSKPNDLLENVFTLFVNCSTRLENDRGKIVVRILKSIAIPVDFLMLRVRFARFSLTKVRRRQGTNHSDIDSKTATEGPVLDGDVTRTATRFVGHTENTQLLQIGGEETGIGELEDDISQAIVPRNSIAGLSAAEGVVAINIHGLLAERTRDRGRGHRLTE